MTITIVCDILGEENNGTTIACMNLIRFLRAQGHTVRVVCADQDKAGNECFYVVPELNLYLLNPIVERNDYIPLESRAIALDNKQIVLVNSGIHHGIAFGAENVEISFAKHRDREADIFLNRLFLVLRIAAANRAY